MSRRVAIIIPTLNEAAAIGPLLAQLARQPLALVAEIIVADGGSSDATRAIVTAAAQRDRRIRLLDNPSRIQAAGINVAVAAASRDADTLIRIDAHADYPDDYVPRIVAAFAATGADMVATRLVTRGVTCTQRGIAAASNSKLGTGGAAHRVGGIAGFVDHGHHAGIDRALFERIGGYDERFAANEDAEFDFRAREAGGRIWLATDIEVGYLPRATLARLFAQYRRYGRGRAMTWRKHGERLRLRQMIPPLAVVSIGLALLGALRWQPLLVVPALYLAAIAVATLDLLRREPNRCTLVAGPAMVVMHFAWAIGFLGSLPTPVPKAMRPRNGHRGVLAVGSITIGGKRP